MRKERKKMFRLIQIEPKVIYIGHVFHSYVYYERSGGKEIVRCSLLEHKGEFAPWHENKRQLELALVEKQKLLTTS